MAAHQTSSPPTAQAPPCPPKHLHSVLWTKVLLFWLRVLPRWLCVSLASPVTFVVFLLARDQRRAVSQNLAALRPEGGRLLHWWGAFEVFNHFGLTYLDRLWNLHFGQPVKWQMGGLEHFEALRNEPGGALVFTIHAGNYDVGSAIFASKLGRAFHTVRMPEQTASLHELRSSELSAQEQANPMLRVHYNASANHLGLELCRLLQTGQIVAIQGDRVVGDVSPMLARLGPLTFRLPRGPLVLAQLTRVPCYAVFLHRTGVLSYSAEVHAPFCVKDEQLSVNELVARWLPLMNGFIQEHWRQWFVFEHLVTRDHD